MPHKHIQLELKVVFSGGSTIHGGLGGRRWAMNARVLVNAEPQTPWVNLMEYPKYRKGPGGTELKTSWQGALSKHTKYKISPKKIKRILRKANEDFDEEKTKEKGKPSVWGLYSSPWSGSGGYGFSGKERHWILG